MRPPVESRRVETFIPGPTESPITRIVLSVTVACSIRSPVLWMPRKMPEFRASIVLSVIAVFTHRLWVLHGMPHAPKPQVSRVIPWDRMPCMTRSLMELSANVRWLGKSPVPGGGGVTVTPLSKPSSVSACSRFRLDEIRKPIRKSTAPRCAVSVTPEPVAALGVEGPRAAAGEAAVQVQGVARRDSRRDPVADGRILPRTAEHGDLEEGPEGGA